MSDMHKQTLLEIKMKAVVYEISSGNIAVIYEGLQGTVDGSDTYEAHKDSVLSDAIADGEIDEDKIELFDVRFE